MKLKGMPLDLKMYRVSDVLTNKRLHEFNMPEFESLYLPESMQSFSNLTVLDDKEFLVDDHRGAVSPSPSLTIDGTDFFTSVKGIGSTTDPFSHHPLGPVDICKFLKNVELRDSIVGSKGVAPRYITGELWLRGSPYGGQGLQHATTSLRVSEMADLTTIHGFRIAPLVKIVPLPEKLEEVVKQIYWYRRFDGRIVQEIRLVPSNVRIYFHSGSTIGGNIGAVFDLFGIDDNDKALAFLRNFVKSGIAYLTLFTRSLTTNVDGTFSGWDFYDVWLDKDAVLAPDGTIYFVDLEGLEWITVNAENVREKIDDQIYRCLYEFIYAYEQIERERCSRFGVMRDRKMQFEYLLRGGLSDDEIVSVERSGSRLELLIGNILHEQSIIGKFPIIDW